MSFQTNTVLCLAQLPKKKNASPYPWKEEEKQEVIRRVKAGETGKNIALDMNISQKVVESKIKKLRTQRILEPPRLTCRWTEKMDAELIAFKAAGLPEGKIAAEMGKTESAVHSRWGKLHLDRIGYIGDDSIADAKRFRVATNKLVALLCEHHPEKETRI